MIVALGINSILKEANYYAISVLLVIAAIALLVWRFEKKQILLRDVVMISVLVSMAVVGRLIFFAVPQVKPCAAIVIITGIMLGKEAGIICGFLTAFVSNFFFGQGPWTPWQMLAFGAVGFVAALVFSGNILEEKENKMVLAVFGFLVVLIVYGLIVDTGSVFMMLDRPTWKGALGIYGAGIVFNITHAIATAVFLWLLAKPLMMKIDRVKKKYGE